MGSKKIKIRRRKAAVSRKKLPLVNFKASSKDQKKIRANAKKYAGGNFSAWMRHASLNYRPGKHEVIR